MEFILKKTHRNTTEQEFIDDVQRVAKVLNKTSITIAEYDKYGNFHSTSLMKRLGKWIDILTKANLSP